MDAVISGYRHFRALRPHVAGFVDKDPMPGGSTFIGLWNQVESCLSSWRDKTGFGDVSRFVEQFVDHRSWHDDLSEHMDKLFLIMSTYTDQFFD
jgi:hypothetical protein